ncbi:tyrosine-type recombinase/integrase [Bacteroides thetaiotaomicron]|jgi:integrase/recombinase XerD|uniref:tyrosine-type recombinase/integrase n=1 Tax=Bacteroides thetaiotaomicron TaxID=818 RepID=UPI0039B3F6B0
MKKITDLAKYLTSFFTEYLSGIRNLSKNTIRAYRDTFRLLLVFYHEVYAIPPEKLVIKKMDDKTIIQYLDWLQKERKCTNSTRNQRLAAIHTFFRYLQLQNPEKLLLCQKILLIPFKKVQKTIIQHLTTEQTKRLLEQPDVWKRGGRRDMVLLSVLYDSGARVQEICDLRVRDVRLESPALITLTGKGCKSRQVPLLGNTVNLLQNYMEEHGLHRNGKQNMPLFYNQRYAALTRGGITHILQKYADKIKCPDIQSKITPHILRHSKAVHLLQAGISIILIRDILGHVSVQTTEMYARVDMETKRKALENAYSNMTPGNMPDWNQDENLLDFLEDL